MAAGNKGAHAVGDAQMGRRIKEDAYMLSAVVECYASMKIIFHEIKAGFGRAERK